MKDAQIKFIREEYVSDMGLSLRRRLANMKDAQNKPRREEYA